MARVTAWELTDKPGRFRFIHYEGSGVVRLEQRFPPYFKVWKRLASVHVTWFDKVCDSWLKFRQDTVKP